VQTVIQRANPASHTGEMGGIACLCLPPIVEDCGFTQLCPRSGRQIIRLHFHRTGQEPLSLFFHDFTAWFSHDFPMVALEGAPDSALRFQFHQGLQLGSKGTAE
jgi:hypothetical protein